MCNTKHGAHTEWGRWNKEKTLHSGNTIDSVYPRSCGKYSVIIQLKTVSQTIDTTRPYWG